MKQKTQNAKHKVPADIDMIFNQVLTIWKQYPICSITLDKNYSSIGLQFTPKINYQIGKTDQP